MLGSLFLCLTYRDALLQTESRLLPSSHSSVTSKGMQSIPQRGALNRKANEKRALLSLFSSPIKTGERKDQQPRLHGRAKLFERLVLHQSLTYTSITLNNKLEAFALCQCCFLSKATVATSISSRRLQCY